MKNSNLFKFIIESKRVPTQNWDSGILIRFSPDFGNFMTNKLAHLDQRIFLYKTRPNIYLEIVSELAGDGGNQRQGGSQTGPLDGEAAGLLGRLFNIPGEEFLLLLRDPAILFRRICKNNGPQNYPHDSN